MKWSEIHVHCSLLIEENISVGVALVGHCVLNGVLDVGQVRSNGLIVALLGQVTDSEGTILRWVLLELSLEWELAITAIGLSVRIEASMLEHRGRVWLTLVEDQSRSSLVVKLPHILLTLIGIFRIGKALLEGLVSRPCHETLRGILWSGVTIWELLHVQELGGLNQFVAAVGLEALGRDRALASILSQEVFPGILKLIAHSIGL